MPKKYTKEILQKAVNNSISFAQVFRKLGLKATGGNYQNIRARLLQFNIDYSHFRGQAWSKGKTQQRISLEDYLSNKRQINSNRLKQKLFKAGIKSQKCEQCGISKWNGQDIILELHHIDGNHFNNHLDNLQILCPNCHSIK